MKDGKYIVIGDQGLHSESLLPGFHLDHRPVQGPITDRCSGLAVTRFAVAAVMMSQGNQSITLFDHVVSTSGEEAERPFKDLMLVN